MNRPAHSPNPEYRASAILAGFVIAFSFFLWLPYVFAERMWPDEALYAFHALKIFQNPAEVFSKELVRFHPPLFPLILSMTHVILPPKMACQLTGFLFGLLGIAGVYGLGRAVHRPMAGLFAAVVLAVHPVYLSYAVKVLIDAPLMLMMCVLAVVLLDAPARPESKRHLLVGAIGMAMVWLKWSGIVIVPVIGLHYLFGVRDIPLKERVRRMLIPCAMIAAAVVLFWIQRGEVFQYGSSLVRAHGVYPKLFYFLHFPQIIGFAGLIPLAVFGLVKIGRSHRPAAVLFSAWTILVLAALSIPAEKQLRFAIILLPPLLLLAGIGAEELTAFLPKPAWRNAGKAGLVVLVMAWAWTQIPLREAELAEDNKFYLGFGEVGEWVRDLMDSETLVVARSPREVLYHARLKGAGINEVTKFPVQKGALEEIAARHRGPILLEVDNWGDPQHTLIDPFTLRTLEEFGKLGFRPEKTVGAMIYDRDQTPVAAPAVWLLRRPARE